MASIERADDPRLAPIRAALTEVATALAQAIVRDGEGATKFITIAVEGGRDAAECREVALSIAHSPLVKTAFFASDPNSAASSARSATPPHRTSIRRVCRSGWTTCGSSSAAVARRRIARRTASG